MEYSKMDYAPLTCLLSSAGFLKATCKFSERQLDGIADCLEFEHVDSSFALFIFADTRLSHSKDFRQLCLGQFRLYSNATKQSEEYPSITLPLSREPSDTLHARSIGII
jgi:hypothetical protein